MLKSGTWLPPDGRRRTVQHASHAACRATVGLHHHDRCSLFRRELFGVLFASQQLTGWTLHLTTIDSAFLDCLTRAFVGSRTDARSLP